MGSCDDVCDPRQMDKFSNDPDGFDFDIDTTISALHGFEMGIEK